MLDMMKSSISGGTHVVGFKRILEKSAFFFKLLIMPRIPLSDIYPYVSSSFLFEPDTALIAGWFPLHPTCLLDSRSQYLRKAGNRPRMNTWRGKPVFE